MIQKHHEEWVQGSTTIRCTPPPSTTPTEGITLPYATKITELEKGMLPLCLILFHCVSSLFLWTKVERDKTEGVWQMWCLHPLLLFLFVDIPLPGLYSSVPHYGGVCHTTSLRTLRVNLMSTHTHVHTSTHHDTSQTRWQEIQSCVTSLFSFMKANTQKRHSSFSSLLYGSNAYRLYYSGGPSADMVNVNRKILNRTHSEKRQSERERKINVSVI